VDDLTRVLKEEEAMQSLLNLFTCARLSGQWTISRLAGMRSTSSRVIREITDALETCRLPMPVPLPVRVPRLGAIVVLPALLMAVLATAPAMAARVSAFETTADGRLVDVQVQVEGRTAPLYFANNGTDRRYFQAFRGRNYSLAVTNKTGRRIGVLIAVDGLNVVNGERSRLASNEAMYVLDPWEHTVIRGWRTSLNDVRKFVFVDEERSYAERTGQANGDMGWIRVLAFNERGRAWFDVAPGRVRSGYRDNGQVPFDSREQSELKRGEEVAPEAQGDESRLDADRRLVTPQHAQPAPQSAVPGTGWGDKSWDPVHKVWFVPEYRATDQLVLRYEYASGLRALGIFPHQLRDRVQERERGELGFAQPPRW
jgi:hypothetical protein